MALVGVQTWCKWYVGGLRPMEIEVHGGGNIESERERGSDRTGSAERRVDIAQDTWESTCGPPRGSGSDAPCSPIGKA